jgi:hypothetical protein
VKVRKKNEAKSVAKVPFLMAMNKTETERKSKIGNEIIDTKEKKRRVNLTSFGAVKVRGLRKTFHSPTLFRTQIYPVLSFYFHFYFTSR